MQGQKMQGQAVKAYDLPAPIGAYAFCNTGSVLVHEIDHGEDRVLASINGEHEEWCDIVEEDIDGEMGQGFRFGSIFVPFSMVMRI